MRIGVITLRACGLSAAVFVASGAWAGDAARGKALYEARCSACHAINENGPGPMHRDLFGRQAGTQSGFGYSPALTQSGIVWSEETLDRWIADPDALVSGNRMRARLAPDTTDRADLIAYLKKASARDRGCQTPKVDEADAKTRKD